MINFNEYYLKMHYQDIRDHIDLKTDHWKHIFTTNCYAFALGLDINEKDIGHFAYTPGVMGKAPTYLPYFSMFTLDNLLENIFCDLDFLDISFYETDPTSPIKLDEWKIALFTSPYQNDNKWLNDYHFLRENPNNIWYHKTGWFSKPTNKDNNAKIITNPKDCYLVEKQYQKCYSLKLK